MGRPPASAGIAAPAGRLATGNHGRGYQRIQGEPRKPGHRVSAPAIRRIRTALKIPPAPKRHADATGRQFPRTQAATMPAAGFSRADCALTLQRRSCLSAVERGSRDAPIPGITANPDGPRTGQQIRNALTDPADRAAGYPVPGPDRAGQCTASSDAVPAEAGIRVAQNPPRSPRANAYPERFARTASTEATDPMLIVGARHPRAILAEYQTHHNRRRPHHSRQLRPPARPPRR